MASKENENTIKKETKNESKVKECPKCGSKDYIPILHGYPSPEAIEKAEKGELILAGCCSFGDETTKQWKNCGESY